MPRTTTELAQELDLSLAAISAHLSRLKVAGLAEPHRSGKRVYYRLSFAGESLLSLKSYSTSRLSYRVSETGTEAMRMSTESTETHDRGEQEGVVSLV